MEDECTIKLPSSVALEVNIIEYGAVITKYKVIADKGSFVQLLLNNEVSPEDILFIIIQYI